MKALVVWLTLGMIFGWQMNNAFSTDTKITNVSNGDTNQNIELDLGLFWDVFETVEDNFIDIENVEDQECKISIN